MIINADILTLLFLIMMITCVVVIVFTERLIHAAIYMGAFSTIAALVFLLIGAPDVALAEAIIGSTLSTIIYIIAIKKHRIFAIYKIINNRLDTIRQEDINSLKKTIDKYLKNNDMQMHMIYTNETLDELSLNDDYSMIIENTENGIIIHSSSISVHTDKIMNELEGTGLKSKVSLGIDLSTFNEMLEEVAND